MAHPRYHLQMPDEFWVWLERQRPRTLERYLDILIYRKTSSRQEAAYAFKITPARLGKIEERFLNWFASYQRSPFYPHDTADEFLAAGNTPNNVPLVYLHLSTRAENILKREEVNVLCLGALLRLDLGLLKREPNCGEKTIKELANVKERYSQYAS